VWSDTSVGPFNLGENIKKNKEGRKEGGNKFINFYIWFI
jgi:hypothetical protein